MKDEENEEKMTDSPSNEEASNEMLPLDQLKETVVAQYGDDARLILDSIDEVEAILLRRQARAKGEFDDAKAIIHLSGLSKKYESAGMTPVDALKEVDLSVVQGEMVAVIGPSGSGKSTLLQMMGALDVPTTGGVRINFQELSEMNPKELTQFRSQTVGFVFQKFNLIPNLSALENVSIAMESTKMNRQERRSRAAELLKEVGLGKRMSHLPDNFQVVNSSEFPLPEHWRITRRSSMQTNPQGRSTQRRVRTIIQLFDRIRRDFNTTIIIVTHNHTIAKHCDRTVKIKDGRIK